MDKNNPNNTLSGNQSIPAAGQKPPTPANPGGASSHGAKLSVNMTSDEKKKLLNQLEEWRKLKREKIAAAMLAKQKQAEKAKISLPVMPLKSKPVPPRTGQERQSVFERLYKNEKFKKTEVPISKENSKEVAKPVAHSLNDQSKVKEIQAAPHKIVTAETKLVSPEIEAQNENVESEPHPNANNDLIETAEMEPAPHLISDQIKDVETQPTSHPINDEIIVADSNPTPQVHIEEKKDEEIKPVLPTAPVQMKNTAVKPVALLMNDQIKTAELKPVKSGLAKKSLPVKKIELGKPKTVLRRSLSMMFHQKRKEQNILRRSISTQSIPKLNAKPLKADSKSFQLLPPRPQVSEIAKKKESVKPTFVTPKSTKPLTSNHLRNKLEDWLKVNGHSLDGYRHLRCFGISDNEKHVFATPIKTINESFENETNKTPPNPSLDDSNKENVTPPTVIRQVTVKDAENWLKELHRLIVELKYPPERCEEWLTAIRKKCTGCNQLPIYWECLAALDESRGDIKSAIADYETAIIKGGEVEAVGDSLAQLFDKMVIESENSRSKAKLEKGIDPKNIFKSTIIKFALQQKALKNLSSELEPGVRKQLYVATPVRRSTRIKTPSKPTDEVASLRTLTPELRQNVTFKPNESLLLD